MKRAQMSQTMNMRIRVTLSTVHRRFLTFCSCTVLVTTMTVSLFCTGIFSRKPSFNSSVISSSSCSFLLEWPAHSSSLMLLSRTGSSKDLESADFEPTVNKTSYQISKSSDSKWISKLLCSERVRSNPHRKRNDSSKYLLLSELGTSLLFLTEVLEI